MANVATNVADTEDITSSDYTAANQIMVGSAAGAYTLLTVGEQRIVGRKTGGNVAALTAGEIITLSGAVAKSTYDAHTILAATTDDTPAALTIAEQRLVGRITGGNIAALTAGQIRTLINVENGADVTDATNVNAAGAVMESDYNAQTILAAITDDTPAALTIGEQTLVGRITGGNIAALTAGQIRTLINVENGADVTDATNVNAAGAVMNSDYDANTILAATTDDTPVTLTIAEQTLVGRITGGNIAALTAGQVRTLINVENGADVTDATNVAAAGAVMKSSYTAADEVMVGSGSATTTQVTLAASQILGKKATGTVTNLSAADVRTIIQTTSYASFWIGPEEFSPSPFSGPALTRRALSSGLTVTGWLFNPAVEQKLFKKINMPDDWNLGTVKAKVYWTTTEAPSAGDVVRWGISGVAISEGDVLNASLGSEVTVDDAVTAAGKVHVTAATGAITIGGTPALADLVKLCIARKAAAAEDTMNEEDAMFLGVSIQYGVNAASPSAW